MLLNMFFLKPFIFKQMFLTTIEATELTEYFQFKPILKTAELDVTSNVMSHFCKIFVEAESLLNKNNTNLPILVKTPRLFQIQNGKKNTWSVDCFLCGANNTGVSIIWIIPEIQISADQCQY